MSRKYKIHWREEDYKEVERVIKNFNNKIYRTKKRHPELADIQPLPIKKREFINSIKTRQDLNRELNSLKRYSKKGNEKPVTSNAVDNFTTTKWEVSEYKRKEGIINTRKTKQKNKLANKDALQGGKKLGYKKSEALSSILEDSLNPTHTDFKNKRKYDWEKFKKRIDKQIDANYLSSINLLYQENYMKALDKENFPPDIKYIINRLDNDRFIERYALDELADIDFVYSLHDLEIRIDTLREIWQDEITKQWNEEFKQLGYSQNTNKLFKSLNYNQLNLLMNTYNFKGLNNKQVRELINNVINGRF